MWPETTENWISFKVELPISRRGLWNETIKTGIAFKMGDEVYNGDLKLLYDGSCWITRFVPINCTGWPHDIEIAHSEIEDYSGEYKKVEVHQILSGYDYLNGLMAFNPRHVIVAITNLYNPGVNHGKD